MTNVSRFIVWFYSKFDGIIQNKSLYDTNFTHWMALDTQNELQHLKTNESSIQPNDNKSKLKLCVSMSYFVISSSIYSIAGELYSEAPWILYPPLND